MAELTEARDATSAEMAHLREELTRVGEEADGIQTALKDTRKLKGEVDGLVGPSGRVDQLRQKSEELADRVKGAREELRELEKALQRSLADLERATALRHDLTGAIRDLGDEERRVSHAVAAAAEQPALMAQLADQVEGRVGNLRFTEKRLTQFEEKLTAFEQSERALERSLQEVAGRQEAVGAVQAEIGELFRAVERTVSEVRSITDARQEIQHTRVALDDVLERAARVDELALAVDREKTEIDDAEERMARLDALVADIQSSLETVRSQKAVVDAVLEKAGQLAFQSKEAEALITALREERDVSGRVLEAVRDVRGQGGAPGALRVGA